MVLEGRSVALRIRLFHDDLQRALGRFAGDTTLRLTPAGLQDSLFTAYVARTFRLEADGRPVSLRVTASSTERDQVAELVVFYVLEGELPRAPDRLRLRHGVLCEVFDDQQNIIEVLRLPDNRRRTLYFTARDQRPQEFAP